MPSEADIRDWNAIAASLGATPKLDEQGNVVPIGKPEARTAYYVVWTGRAVGIFSNWGLAHAMVNGYYGAAYKKYLALDEARRGWEEGPSAWRGKWRPPAPQEFTAAPPSRVKSSASKNATDVQYDVHNAPARIPIHLSPHEAAGPSSNDEYGSAEEGPPPSACQSEKSLHPDSPLTSGTLSPRTIRTPAIPTPLLASPPSPPPQRQSAGGEIIYRSISCGPTRREAPLIKRSDLNSVKATRSATNASKDKKSHSSASAVVPSSPMLPLFLPDPIETSPTKEVFVVVRGDRPGVYFDRNTAMLMLGTSPGMKIVRFESRKNAAWYFVQEYMAGRVGIPIVVVSD